jgi:hypothetical protein
VRSKTVAMTIDVFIIGITVAVGVAAAVTAGASGTSTYYACLKAGKLTKVGASAPTCVAPATQISWNSQGPPGADGAIGAQGPAGPQGPPGATLNTCTTPPGPGLN